MGNTSIEWTDKTLNPLRARRRDTGKVGWYCEHASPGCIHCYAETFNGRHLPKGGTALAYSVPNRDKLEIFLDTEMLKLPLQWRKPSRIFLCSMTDLFGEFVPDDLIAEVWRMISKVPRHTFNILTKRADRMAELMPQLVATFGVLPTAWLGVSVDNQQYADQRTPLLLRTPAAKRWISYEPALGPVDFRIFLPSLGWIIVGGESGPGARPFNLSWVRSVIMQCKASDVACFVKQLGKFPIEQSDHSQERVLLNSGKGGDPSEWPEDLRVREFPFR